MNVKVASNNKFMWAYKPEVVKLSYLTNVELLILGYKYSSTVEQIEREVIPNSALSECFAC